MPVKVELKFDERNVTISGLVSDEQAIYFASYLFNEEEKRIYNEGRFKEAALLLLKRREDTLKVMNPEDYAELILNQLFVTYSSQALERTEIITRLCEIFDFPEEMIKDRRTREDQPRNYKICLDRVEVAQIMLGIIGTLSNSESEVTKSPTIETPVLKKEQSPITASVVTEDDDNQAKLQQLMTQVKALESRMKPE